MDNDKKLKFFIWGGFALATCVILAWPVVKLITKSVPQEISFPEGAPKAFSSGSEETTAGAEAAPDLPMPLRYQAPASYDARAKAARYPAGPRETAPAASAHASGASGALFSSYNSYDQAGQAAPNSGKQRELDFIRTHEMEIRAYQTRLTVLGLKYITKYPALRRMDSDFARMPRYMALKKQYERDLNAYNFARGMTALPEVRSAIIRYSANPDVVMALMSATMEAVKNPPPKAIQAEVANFFAENPQTTTYVNDVLTQAIGNAMPTISSIPGKDLATLQKIGSGVMGGDIPGRINR